MRRVSMILASIALLGAVVGCASPYMLEKPRVFNSCLTVGDDPRQVSFEAILKVLSQRRGYIIDNLDRDMLVVKLRAYRGDGQIPLLVTIDQAGGVEIIRDPSQPKALSRKWGRLLKRWMDMLEARYSREKCHDL